MMPAISVVTPTFGRGRHILPTIRSVLAQSFSDFEYLVVGDGVTDDTEAAVRSVADDRVRWINLDRNHGSQSFPNNTGIAEAKTSLIAYLGHDDIWALDHLRQIVGLFDKRAGLDYAVSGCALHGQPGSGYTWITGMFSDPAELSDDMFPPCSLAHRRDVIDRIGGWRQAAEVVDPIDVDMQKRAMAAGMSFASTQTITVHKFAAAGRYLSYLKQSSDEQEAMLTSFGVPDCAERQLELVAKAKAAGTFMCVKFPDRAGFAPGRYHEINRKNRGLSRPELKPLDAAVRIDQDDGSRGHDWQPFHPGETRFRWAHINPKPKILIPYSSDQPVRFRMQLVGRRSDAFDAVRLLLNGRPYRLRTGRPLRLKDHWEVTGLFDGFLEADAYSILELDILSEAGIDPGDIGVGEIFLAALPEDEAALPHLDLVAGLFSTELDAEHLRSQMAQADAEHERIAQEEQSARLAANSHRSRHKAEHLQNEVDYLKAQLAGLKDSFAWKATSPFRELRRVASRLMKPRTR